MRNAAHSQRGQVLPIWISTIILSFIFSYFLISFGQVVAYQFRVQSAADSVANAVVALQAQDFNQMLATLYAIDVDEFRLRSLLEDLRVSAELSGGCQDSSTNPPSIEAMPSKKAGGTYIVTGPVSNACIENASLAFYGYLQALNRYNAEAGLLNQITLTMNLTNLQKDATQLVSDINNSCQGGQTVLLNSDIPCDAKNSNIKFYINAYRVRDGVMSFSENPNTIQLPSYTTGLPILARGSQASGTPTLNSGEYNDSMFGPIYAEIIACAQVPPVIGYKALTDTTTVVARAAATNVILEEDWLQPGQVRDSYDTNDNPLPSYQPLENYVGLTSRSGGSSAGVQTGPVLIKNPFDPYAVNFGGNLTTYNQTTHALTAPITTNELSVRVGWWGPMLILPYTSTGPTSKTYGNLQQIANNNCSMPTAPTY